MVARPRLRLACCRTDPAINAILCMQRASAASSTIFLVVVQSDFKVDHHHPFVRSRITQKLLFVVSQPFADLQLDFGLMDFCAQQ